MRYSGPGFILYNGRPVLQSSSIDFNFDSDNKDVNTLLLGRAGHSAGAKNVKVSVSGAIPAGGLEVDWVAICDAQAEVNLGFVLAGKTYNCAGDVRTTKLGTSTDKANGVDFEFSARLVNTV